MRKAKKKPIKPHKLVLVISNIANEAAATLVDEFPPGCAALITASNFYQSFKLGVGVNGFSASRLTINGREMAAADITGVVCTITNFFPQEFYYIQPADRQYVCAEMNAFFTYFLHELPCKKINPPSTRSFSGMCLHKMEWLKKAHALNIPVWPLRLKNGTHVGETQNVDAITVCKYTIIAGQMVGSQPPPAVQEYLHALEHAFCLPYLQAYFVATNDGAYHLADLLSVPDISSQANRAAIIQFFSKNNVYDSFMGPDGRRTDGYGAHSA